MLFALGSAILAGLDCFLTYKRMQLLGPGADLNPLVSKIARELSILQAALFLGLMNALIIAGLVILDADKTLAMFFGLKLGLFIVQVKGYILIQSHIKSLQVRG